MKLFAKEKTVGVFRGFSEGGLEFHADITLPYRNEFQRFPMHGQFLVVQLEDETEAVFGRITSVSSQGRLASGAGEDYGIRAVAEDREIPEELREQHLKYRIDVRMLGVVRVAGEELVFVASHRRLPHVGSRVAFLDDEVLREVAGHNLENGAEIGFFSLGEFIYSGDDDRLGKEPWMRTMSPAVVPKFRVRDMVARRTFVFARAGFGKSNLVKYLFSNLYGETPTVEKRGGKRVPVGTIIFDPEGEYFWPDDKNRPGLCDVPELEDKIVVFTPKEGPSPFYGSFVAGDIKLDIRRLRPVDVISIALSPERQDQQNVRKLKGMNDSDWHRLVDLVYRDGNGADGDTIRELMGLERGQDAEMIAARANMTTIVKMLHDPSSQMMDILLTALRKGKLCVVDVSKMRGTPALILSGLILRRIFDHNQEEFTKAEPKTIPVIAVLEEAQTVLGNRGSSSGGEGPYVEWVKEGRKYDLGAVLITQQPGAISGEILSQGDNWFAFHLLSAGDLRAVKNANAHFSDDILSSLLNEPIPGHGIFWSSVGGKSYPIPIRVLLFENEHQARDPNYEKSPLKTSSASLREEFDKALASAQGSGSSNKAAREKPHPINAPPAKEEMEEDEKRDALDTYKSAAVEKFKSDKKFLERLRSYGVPWRGVIEKIRSSFPDLLDDTNKMAHNLVPEAMTAAFGEEGPGWTTEKRESKSGTGYTTWVVIPKKDNSTSYETEK